MTDNSSNNNWLIYVLLGLVSFFVLFRLMIIFRFILFIALGFGAIFGTIYLIRDYKKRKAYNASIEGQIDSKLYFCQEMISKNKLELVEIDRNFKELKLQMRNEDELESDTWKELQRLTAGFAAEKKLRQTKINFFRACMNKLERLKKNHEIARDLERRQSKLKTLREGQLEELAEMESLRSDLAYDQAYLETIDQLSLRLLDSQSPEQAIAIQRELENITRDLNN